MSTGVVFQSTLQKACKSKGIHYDFSLRVLICLKNSSEYRRVSHPVPIVCACTGGHGGVNLSDSFFLDFNPGEGYSSEIQHSHPAAADSQAPRSGETPETQWLSQLLSELHSLHSWSCKVQGAGRAGAPPYTCSCYRLWNQSILTWHITTNNRFRLCLKKKKTVEVGGAHFCPAFV